MTNRLLLSPETAAFYQLWQTIELAVFWRARNVVNAIAALMEEAEAR